MITLSSRDHIRLTATLSHKPWLRRMMGKKAHITAALEVEPIPVEAAEQILRVLDLLGEPL